MSASTTSKKPAHRYIAVPCDKEGKLYAATEAAAKQAKKSIGGYVQSLLAAQFKLTLPVSTRGPRRKYANETERKAALKTARTERNALIKQLLAKYAAEQAAAEKAAAAA